MIPLATTTIDVLRPDTSADDYETDTGPTTVFSGVRAQISSPKGRGSELAGQSALVDKELHCDPTEIRHYDVVRDNVTNFTYSVIWVDQRIALGLDHTHAGLKRSEGAA